MDWTRCVRADRAATACATRNCVAIAPTATISNIIGVSPSIEPTFQNLYVKSNLSGEFTVVNDYLVRDLKARGLWDEVMVDDLKYFDGSLSRIDRVPAGPEGASTRRPSRSMPTWLVEAAARRQKWIDQAQSLNIYMAGASGKKLDETYKLAWLRGLKTTYYLRTMARRTSRSRPPRTGALNAVPVDGGLSAANAAAAAAPVAAPAASADMAEGAACYLRPGDAGFDECEACQ